MRISKISILSVGTLEEYVHNGAKLYMANEFDLKDGQYLASDWITSKGDDDYPGK